MSGHPHWMWLAAGVVLIALEALVPGAVLIWFGVAAVATGLMVLMLEPAVEFQLLFFSIVAVGSTIGFRVWQRSHPAPVPVSDSGEELNNPAAHFIGHELTLATDLRGGSGRVKAADSSWRCTGPDLPAGSKVRVTAVESGRLVVEAVSAED